jgi:hypothetical protein
VAVPAAQGGAGVPVRRAAAVGGHGRCARRPPRQRRCASG